MWTKKEVVSIIIVCLISSGLLLYGAISEVLIGQPFALSVIAVILSAVMIYLALYVFDDYIESIGE
jgi:hypothetical protein